MAAPVPPLEPMRTEHQFQCSHNNTNNHGALPYGDRALTYAFFGSANKSAGAGHNRGITNSEVW